MAPSGAGLAIATASAAGFLVRHPGRMYWKNRHRLQASPRYGIARSIAVAYAVISGGALLVAWAMAGARPLVPFLVATPFFLLFAAYDMRHEARRLLPEVLAPAAIAASAPAIVLADGWSGRASFIIWLLLALRSIPTVIYVRARLRQERKRPRSATVSNAAHGTAVVAGSALAGAGLAPWSAVAGLVVLLFRAAAGLSRFHRPAAPKAIGLSEIGYGTLFVLLTAAGYWSLS